MAGKEWIVNIHIVNCIISEEFILTRLKTYRKRSEEISLVNTRRSEDSDF